MKTAPIIEKLLTMPLQMEFCTMYLDLEQGGRILITRNAGHPLRKK